LVNVFIVKYHRIYNIPCGHAKGFQALLGLTFLNRKGKPGSFYNIIVTTIYSYYSGPQHLDKLAFKMFHSKVKQPIVVKIKSLTSCCYWNFSIFYIDISVRNNESNWNYFFLTKYKFTMNFRSVQCIIAPKSL